MIKKINYSIFCDSYNFKTVAFHKCAPSQEMLWHPISIVYFLPQNGQKLGFCIGGLGPTVSRSGAKGLLFGILQNPFKNPACSLFIPILL